MLPAEPCDAAPALTGEHEQGESERGFRARRKLGESQLTCDSLWDRGEPTTLTIQPSSIALGGSRWAAAKESLYLFHRNLPILIDVDRFEDFDMGCLDFLK